MFEREIDQRIELDAIVDGFRVAEFEAVEEVPLLWLFHISFQGKRKITKQINDMSLKES